LSIGRSRPNLTAHTWLTVGLLNCEKQIPVERPHSITKAQRLKPVFGIDIETCPACGGVLWIIACIEDPVMIKKILTHLNTKSACPQPARLPPSRAPPPAGLF